MALDGKWCGMVCSCWFDPRQILKFELLTPYLHTPQAVFTLQVEVPAGYTALSNTPIATRVASTLPNAAVQLEMVTFQTTPAMPSYLLGLAVGRLYSVSKTTASGKTVSVYATPTDLIYKDFRRNTTANTAQRPLDFAASALAYYESLTGKQLPLSKVDFVSVPGRVGDPINAFLPSSMPLVLLLVLVRAGCCLALRGLACDRGTNCMPARSSGRAHRTA